MKYLRSKLIVLLTKFIINYDNNSFLTTQEL